MIAESKIKNAASVITLLLDDQRSSTVRKALIDIRMMFTDIGLILPLENILDYVDIQPTDAGGYRLQVAIPEVKK
ncbi:TPA: hypothetical protein JAN03_20270 [Citrobacter freundii]|nr:hypothetical protein [Citrobacter freundii]